MSSLEDITPSVCFNLADLKDLDLVHLLDFRPLPKTRFELRFLPFLNGTSWEEKGFILSSNATKVYNLKQKKNIAD